MATGWRPSAFQTDRLAGVRRQARSEETRSESDVGNGTRSRHDVGMGCGGASQHRVSARPCCASGHRSEGAHASTSPRICPIRNSKECGEAGYGADRISNGSRHRRSSTSRSASEALYISGPHHQFTQHGHTRSAGIGRRSDKTPCKNGAVYFERPFIVSSEDGTGGTKEIESLVGPFGFRDNPSRHATNG